MRRTGQVAGEIQEMIRRESIPPGGRLPAETALAKRFHVSRPMVREAIQALKALGIVESRPRTGLRVLAFDPGAHFDQIIPRLRTDQERAELYELRRLLEPALLELVAARATRADLDALEAPLRRPLPRGPEGLRQSLARDVDFHEGLWRLAGNRFVLSFRGILLRYFADLEARPGRRIPESQLRKANDQHRAIVRALRAGDVDRARRALSRNLATFAPREATA